MYSIDRIVLPGFGRLRRGLLALTLVLTSLAIVLLPTHHAVADGLPPDPTTPATVTADVLPTVQVDGVVWAQVTVGNTVYATGNFTTAWPAGTTKGGPGTVPAGNIIAYDITTGAMLTSFSHTLDAQGLSIAASPDGSRVYVGGDFLNVDGVPHARLAAFDTATGTLVSAFSPTVSATVQAITATNSTVYVGGQFFNVSGHTRTRLAALAAADGSLLSWNPSADDNTVEAMVLSPDQSRVIVGGKFSTINGITVNGMGSVSTTDASLQPWAINTTVKDFGNQCGILSLSTDGKQIYGSGYAFGCGNFEGSFAADPNTGNVIFVNDCHGDTYSTFPSGQVFYLVGHAHDCSAISQFPDTNPRTWHRALAFTTYAASTNTGPDSYGWNYTGVPDAQLLHWYPSLTPGTFTGQQQAAWSVTGNANYIALGGEFPTVNGVAQSGLVRFAVHSIAPKKSGPLTIASTTPVAVSLTAGTARVTWQSTWDRDNIRLTYSLYRDGGTTPIYTATQDSNFWQQPWMGYLDTGLVPGSTHTYKVRVFDPDNNKLPTPDSNVVTISAATTTSNYVNDVQADGASSLWRFNEASGNVGYDWAGFNDQNELAGVVEGAAGPLSNDPGTAATFSGTSTGTSASTALQAAPNTFSVEAWFRTNTRSGGMIVGFGNSPTGLSSSFDRHVYMDNSGHLLFGVYNGAARTVSSASTYNDGNYHQVVGTFSAAGLALYVDGKLVGRDQTVTTANPYSGYWRVGGDSLSGWGSKPSSNYFSGTIADVAVYPTALSLAQAQHHYTDSGRTLNIAAAPTDAYGQAVYADNPDLYWRLNDTSGNTAADTGRNNTTGVYSSGGTTKGVTGAFATSQTAVSFDGNKGALASSQQYQNPQVYSEELWFKTGTTKGGKLIGFGTSQTGTSSSYDRQVYMTTAGTLVFGAYNGSQVTITSPKAYNDNSWHYLVATQGPDGMVLYVDGLPVGSNANSVAQTYNGYWRVAADRTWSGSSATNFAGTIDEVAVYGAELPAGRVIAHFDAAGGNLVPTAAFSQTCNSTACAFDGTASSDPDGTIASYAWAFGDGSTGTGAMPAHTYATAGSYPVSLTVTDNGGATNTVTKTVTVTGAPAPTAAFTSSCPGLRCSFDGTGSTSAGTVTSWAWNYGDGASGSGSTAQHAYAAPGSYVVSLTVTDSFGGSNTTTQTVTVANLPPAAAFTASCQVLSCSFDGTSSSDPDGTVASYSWNFGDGSSGTGATATHSYATSGTYTVTLTVTDNLGATNSTSQLLTAANQPPIATFASSCTALSCSFDGTGSSDPDGSVAGYSWNYSDGSTDTAATVSHTFAAAGDYPVTLTVTDNLGATTSVTKVITVRPAANPNTDPYAVDTFNRTVTGGWGTADSGGAWTATGITTNLSVTPGAAKLSMPKATAGPGVYLGSVSSTDTDVLTTVALDKIGDGGGTSVYAVGRRVALNTEYRGVVHVLATGVVNVGITKLDGSATTVSIVNEVAVPGLTYTANTKLNVRFEVTGTNPTTLRLRVWAAGTTEPTAWQISKTDASPSLQTAGAVGISAYLSGTATVAPVTATVSSFRAEPTNTPPVAAIAASCTGLACSVDGTGSTDTQRNIASYTWSWGDGTTTMGATSTHTYAVAGTYRITLTVTDTTGLTSVVTQTVSVTP